MNEVSYSAVEAVSSGIFPTREHFRELAAKYRVVPVSRTLLADLTTPLAAFARLCGDDANGRNGFLLESVDHGGRWSRWSFIGRNPRARIVAKEGQITVSGALPDQAVTDAGLLDLVDSLLGFYKSPPADELTGAGVQLPPLHSGLVGYIGYDVVREIEHLPEAPPNVTGRPDAVLSLIGELAAYDHYSQQVTLIASAFIDTEDPSVSELDALYDDAINRLDVMASDGALPLDEPLVEAPSPGALPDVTTAVDPAGFKAAVEAAKELIRAGDIFQVVLSQRFDFELEADPLDVYRVLRRINPSPYMYFVREDEITLVGCSPEPMVQLLEGRVISRPIAGTRFRGADDAHDRRLAAELLEHPKERAEHTMLVDLARNDLGRVVEFGTCNVDELMTLERFSHVMHLTSQVSGDLAAGRTPVDVLRATLPAGTVSGAPKVRAMEIIDSFEPQRRGPYAGVVGYLDFSGNIDTAIAIRTMFIDPASGGGTRLASVQAGAGVVADSDPTDEELETRNKAKALLVAVEPATAITRMRRASAGQSRKN
ncbi:MAG: chorismate-binding protein [Microthrixaceae bacterium]|nr:chorismate-binding protein [Microthrixaceae bacterium]